MNWNRQSFGVLALMAASTIVLSTSLRGVVATLAALGLTIALGLALVEVVRSLHDHSSAQQPMVERGVFVVIASLSIVVALGFFVNVVANLNRASWLVASSATVAVLLTASAILRVRKPEQSSVRGAKTHSDGVEQQRLLGPVATLLTLAVASAFTITAVLLAITSSATHDEQQFSQLWLVATSSPSPNAEAELGVSNHEGIRTTYVVRLYRGPAQRLTSTLRLELNDQQRFTKMIQLHAGEQLTAILSTPSQRRTVQRVVLKPSN